MLALFTNNATENGKLVTSLVGDYEKLFAKTERIELRLENVTWHAKGDNDQNSFRVQGNFVGIYTYKNGTTPRYTGGIASLVYSFRRK